VDFASETANMTSQNVIQQAAAAVLSQANNASQIALSLLQG
ncbi:MAG: flagellin, partial [Succinivibrionaceae bacterium]|nr:flagellin [Succinivibrionaceae bacterium]